VRQSFNNRSDRIAILAPDSQRLLKNAQAWRVVLRLALSVSVPADCGRRPLGVDSESTVVTGNNRPTTAAHCRLSDFPEPVMEQPRFGRQFPLSFVIWRLGIAKAPSIAFDPEPRGNGRRRP
jgi:hypothetical protein